MRLLWQNVSAKSRAPGIGANRRQCRLTHRQYTLLLPGAMERIIEEETAAAPNRCKRAFGIPLFPSLAKPPPSLSPSGSSGFKFPPGPGSGSESGAL
eukprot:522117-Rhodomonas_salina.1